MYCESSQFLRIEELQMGMKEQKSKVQLPVGVKNKLRMKVR